MQVKANACSVNLMPELCALSVKQTRNRPEDTERHTLKASVI